MATYVMLVTWLWQSGSKLQLLVSFCLEGAVPMEHTPRSIGQEEAETAWSGCEAACPRKAEEARREVGYRQSLARR